MTGERVRALLRPEIAAEPAPGGYLDCVGDGAVARSGAVQDLMFTGALPVVYERFWRPAWSRLAKGPFGPSMAGELQLATQALAVRPGDGVLDVGCGPGNFCRPFARAVGPAGLAVGLDASPSMLARAVRDTPDRDVEYVRGDAEGLPFRDASFDAVCCFAALNLLDDPHRALLEMARVLTPGGRLAVLTSCRTRLAPNLVFDLLAERSTGMRVFGREELVDELEVAGFRDVDRQAFGVLQLVAGVRG